MPPRRRSNRLARRSRRGVRRLFDRVVLSTVNGIIYVAEGASRPSMGNAARDLVLEHGKLRLHRIRPLADESFELGHAEYRVGLAQPIATPVLLIPPLMVRPYVYDLRPEHSLVRTLRNAGFDVFVVDFGVPDEEDADIRLDDYVVDYLPKCIDRALEVSGAPQLSLLGYCMGGIFALLHVATYADARVRNLVTIGAPVDFTEMGVISVAGRLGVVVIDQLMDRLGNVPGALSSLGFKVMSGTRSLSKYADLLVNLSDESYVRGFDAINTWVNDLIPYPKEAFKQMVKDVVSSNKLVTGELCFDGRPADLKTIHCPLLAFAGESDNIATPRATKRIVDIVSSEDKSFHSVPGGHVGVIAGSHAPQYVWSPLADWLRRH